MACQYSQLDRSNLEWFDKDTSKATLIKLEIRKGNLRGLSDPVGFFGKYQGIQVKEKTPSQAAEKITETLIKKPQHRSQLLQGAT